MAMAEMEKNVCHHLYCPTDKGKLTNNINITMNKLTLHRNKHEHHDENKEKAMDSSEERGY